MPALSAHSDFVWQICNEYGSRLSSAQLVLLSSNLRLISYSLPWMRWQKNGEEAALRKYPFVIELYKDLQDFWLVRDQLVNVLIAGRDTTACLMSWAFFLLVRHPNTLDKLRSEIHQVTEGSPELTRARIKRMKYLRCVLNESKFTSKSAFKLSLLILIILSAQRLYPQLPMNVRVAAKTTVIPSGGGPDGKSPVLIPQGTGVGYSVYHMHRLRSLYGEDANEFRPERWLDQELEGIGWGFMPFHGGPRICLGSKYQVYGGRVDGI